MSKGSESPLVAAARLLADDLSRFEALSADVGRQAINSEKSLLRARQGLQACADHETKLAESLRGFALAMQTIQTTQHRCMDSIAAAAKRVQERQEQRAKLQARLSLLGDTAREVSAPVAALSEASVTPSTDMLEPLQEVERRLESIIAEAAEVCALAHGDDWADVERDTRSLEQQLQAVKNRVLLFRRKLSQTAPS